MSAAPLVPSRYEGDNDQHTGACTAGVKVRITRQRMVGRIARHSGVDIAAGVTTCPSWLPLPMNGGFWADRGIRAVGQKRNLPRPESGSLTGSFTQVVAIELFRQLSQHGRRSIPPAAFDFLPQLHQRDDVLEWG